MCTAHLVEGKRLKDFKKETNKRAKYLDPWIKEQQTEGWNNFL